MPLCENLRPACNTRGPRAPRAAQVRICTRMNLRLLSTPFENKEYYTNIRKAVTAGYFMQASAREGSEGARPPLTVSTPGYWLSARSSAPTSQWLTRQCPTLMRPRFF
jgi:hypothetical protein